MTAKRAGGAAPSGAQPFFSDDFAGLQRNNANGFTWDTGPTVGVSIVNFDGYNAMRFRWLAGVKSAEEQRYNMGRYLAEVWMDYDIHIPSNFVHGAAGLNNKFFKIWRDVESDFDGGTAQAVLEYWNLSGTERASSTGRAMLRKMESGGGQFAITDIVGDASYQTPLIGGTGPLLLGAWNRIRVNLRGSSAYGVADGHYKIWCNDTLYTNVQNHLIHNTYTTPTDVLFRNGYFMGSANSTFVAQTDFHIKVPKWYETDPGWV